MTVAEAGLRGASDLEHLGWARREGYVIFTQDSDFLRLHAEGVSHAGIVFAAQGASIGDIIRGLLLVREVLGPDDVERHVEFL